MKKQLRRLLALGFIVTLLGSGTAVLNSYAADGCLDPQSPLRGTWSYSQEEATHPLFGNLPIAAVGVIKVDNCGRFQGHAFDNIPCQDANCFGFGTLGVKNPLEVTFDGQVVTQADGMATVVGTAFGAEFRRACVMIEKRGSCFQEFRCVSSDPEPPNAVLLATFKRQLPGTCQ